MLKKLNSKHIAFCEEYVKNFRNATKAYAMAFKVEETKSSTRASASKLLKDELIQKEIRKQEQELTETGLDNGLPDIIKFLLDVIHTDSTDLSYQITTTKTVKKADGSYEDEPVQHIFLKDKKDLTPEQRRVIKDYKETDRGSKVITTYDKQWAIEQLLKIQVMLTNNDGDTDINALISDVFKDFTEEDKKKALENIKK